MEYIIKFNPARTTPFPMYTPMPAEKEYNLFMNSELVVVANKLLSKGFVLTKARCRTVDEFWEKYISLGELRSTCGNSPLMWNALLIGREYDGCKRVILYGTIPDTYVPNEYQEMISLITINELMKII